MDREKIKERCIELAKQSQCSRVQFGAVIVKNNKIVGEGYNAPIIDGICGNYCLRSRLGITHGLNLELCYALHAEQMALKNAGKKAEGADLYIVGIKHGKFLMKVHPRFVACVICAIHEIAYGIKNIYDYNATYGWSKATPKQALETAIDLAINQASYLK